MVQKLLLEYKQKKAIAQLEAIQQQQSALSN